MFDASVLIHPMLFCILVLILARRWRKPALPYPPGPKGYPILGNALDLPTSIPICENFVSLANKHGTPQLRSISCIYRDRLLTGTDILYLRVLGDDMVVLSSSEAISDLLEKRSSIYSDRVSHSITILTIHF